MGHLDGGATVKECALHCTLAALLTVWLGEEAERFVFNAVENLIWPLHQCKTLYGSLVLLQKPYILTTSFKAMRGLTLHPSAASSLIVLAHARFLPCRPQSPSGTFIS